MPIGGKYFLECYKEYLKGMKKENVSEDSAGGKALRFPHCKMYLKNTIQKRMKKIKGSPKREILRWIFEMKMSQFKPVNKNFATVIIEWKYIALLKHISPLYYLRWSNIFDLF